MYCIEISISCILQKASDRETTRAYILTETVCAESKLKRDFYYWVCLQNNGFLQIQACGANFRTFATNNASEHIRSLKEITVSSVILRDIAVGATKRFPSAWGSTGKHEAWDLNLLCAPFVTYHLRQ